MKDTGWDGRRHVEHYCVRAARHGLGTARHVLVPCWTAWFRMTGIAMLEWYKSGMEGKGRKRIDKISKTHYLHRDNCTVRSIDSLQ